MLNVLQIRAVELLMGCSRISENNVFTLHFDNMNAVTVVEKGSGKFRLQNYAMLVDNLCRTKNISLNPVWIPKCLNNVADILSKMLGYQDYSVQDHFYQYVQEISGFDPNFDRLANNWNAKCSQFNSLAFSCVGSNGVNAFNYPWGGQVKNWLFPPPRLIIPTILHLQKSFATGLLLIPHWKNAVFYPFVMESSNQTVLKNR
jgi:hypothetical protein